MRRLLAFVECEQLTALELQAFADPALAALRCAADGFNVLIAGKGDWQERACLTLWHEAHSQLTLQQRSPGGG